jgi:ABC-type branched-subunit amino acid transport system substrate-binding protein
VADTGFGQRLDEQIRQDTSRRRRWIKIVASLVALLVLGAALLLGWQVRRTCGLSDALARTGLTGVCHGVSDGSYVYGATDLEPVARLIHRENMDVEKSGRYVTVAYWASWAPAPDKTSTTDSIRHALEGAFVAQWRANHTRVLGDEPKIRLVLADPGPGAVYWREVVDTLKGMAGGHPHLVAVAGLGTSTEATKRMIGELSTARIAMFGAIITSTELNGKAFPGLVRMAPNNKDEAAAAVRYLAPTTRRAMLVQDQKSSDNYVTTLGSAFKERFLQAGDGHRLTSQVETYNSELPNVGGRFAQIASAACLEKPDIVYFAGRGKQLTEFLKALGHRGCPDRPITVVSGDDASEISVDNEVKDALTSDQSRRPVKLIYTGLAHPDQWKDPKTPEAGNFQQFLKAHSELFPGKPGSLQDGQAMMAHDAVLAAATAIRASSGQSQGRIVPSPQEVVQNLAGLHGNSKVAGASGMIDIDGETGDPINKPMPILELRGDGTVSFVKLGWPAGAPPTPSNAGE